MPTLQVSDKGRITIPAKVRRELGIQPGSRVELEVCGNEIVIRPIRSVRSVRGIFHEAAKDKSADWETIRNKMEQAVAEEVMRRGRE